MEMKYFRRRRFLIDRNLQIRFIAASLGYVAFYIFVMAAATFIPLIFLLRNAKPESHIAYLLANNLIYLHRHVWPIALLVLVLVSVHSLWLSHRVAGPLYRFRKIFQSLAAGKIPDQQQLRKKDYLQPEMKLINEMLQNLQSRTAGLQEAQKAIADSISGVVRRSRIMSDSELTALVEDLENQGKQLEKHATLFCKES
jgi:methyl-accepting chemotaxis protein